VSIVDPSAAARLTALRDAIEAVAAAVIEFQLDGE
jgi:hypothetical protein